MDDTDGLFMNWKGREGREIMCKDGEPSDT